MQEIARKDSRLNQSFRLTLKNRYAINTVYLPRDFRGPVHSKTVYGATIFSEAVQQNLRDFGKQDGVGKAFIGELGGYGEDKSAPWDGDELILTNEHGRNLVYFADEANAPLFGKKGLFGSLFGGL